MAGADGSGQGPADSGSGADDIAAAVRARQFLLEHIASSRGTRLRRTLAVLMTTMSVLVLLTAGGGWLLAGYLNGSLARVNAGTAGMPTSGPLNILVAGVDIRAGLTARQQALLHVGYVASHNSDTLMVVHVSADRRSVQVISLPRDSWVRIPGFGMNKINAAIGLGGPTLMVRTVRQATGLEINDFVEVNFLGFVKIIDALGGVNICLPFAVDDSYSGLHLSAGRHHVNGVTALEFARDRHSFARSDLARISDQQQLIASVIRSAVSSGLATDPVRFSRFLAAAASAVRVDQHFDLIGLANQLRFIRPSSVTFMTVPLANVDYLTPNGQSAVLWDGPAAQALFARVSSDQVGRRAHRAASEYGTGNGQQTAARAACR
jgi:LCP family protein required for cell wall assembly